PCREGSLHHQRHVVRAGGGEHRWQDHRQWQTRPDDEPVARNLPGFRPRHRGVDRAAATDQAAAEPAFTGGIARKLMQSRFHALMVEISTVRLTLSASENCALTAS